MSGRLAQAVLVIAAIALALADYHGWATIAGLIALAFILTERRS